MLTLPSTGATAAVHPLRALALVILRVVVCFYPNVEIFGGEIASHRDGQMD